MPNPAVLSSMSYCICVIYVWTGIVQLRVYLGFKGQIKGSFLLLPFQYKSVVFHLHSCNLQGIRENPRCWIRCRIFGSLRSRDIDFTGQHSPQRSQRFSCTRSRRKWWLERRSKLGGWNVSCWEPERQFVYHRSIRFCLRGLCGVARSVDDNSPPSFLSSCRDPPPWSDSLCYTRLNSHWQSSSVSSPQPRPGILVDFLVFFF